MSAVEARKLVFIPSIGFRPTGTRTLREPAQTTQDGTRLIVLAVAAAPERTDVIVEWERIGDPATCPPGSNILVHSNMAPLERGLVAKFAIGTTVLSASTMARRSFHFGRSIGAIDAIRFPAFPAAADAAELRLTEGLITWRVPLSLVAGGTLATPLAVETTESGVTVKATALARHEDELIVEVEIEAGRQIRQVGAPMPVVHGSRDLTEEDLRARRAELYRHFGDRARPITLDDDRGASREEQRRLFTQEPQQDSPGGAFTSRFTLMFPAPDKDATRATLVIPFIELVDFGPSARADLRSLPLDVDLAEHRFRVVAVEPHGADQQKVVLELPPSAAGPSFAQPARLHGSDDDFGWQRQDAHLPGHNAIWMATKIGDPPIVTFTGVVLRVDGPLRLELPLADEK